MSKKSAEFDMKDSAGRAGLEPLLKEADVVTANLRPGVMERLGLGPAPLYAEPLSSQPLK